MSTTRQKDLGLRRPGESSGKFAAAGHDEAPSLGQANTPAEESEAAAIARWATPTEQDIADAREFVAQHDKFTTASDPNGQVYLASEPGQRAIIRNARLAAEQQGPLRAHQAGESHPHDQFFSDIWEGKDGAQGFGREHQIRERAILLQLRADLDARRIRPAAIIGTGYRKGINTRRRAEDYLADRIADVDLSMTSEGRNIAVNQSNAASYYRRSVANQKDQ